jgi:hypothetical protein
MFCCAISFNCRINFFQTTFLHDNIWAFYLFFAAHVTDFKPSAPSMVMVYFL